MQCFYSNYLGNYGLITFEKDFGTGLLVWSVKTVSLQVTPEFQIDTGAIAASELLFSAGGEGKQFVFSCEWIASPVVLNPLPPSKRVFNLMIYSFTSMSLSLTMFLVTFVSSFQKAWALYLKWSRCQACAVSFFNPNKTLGINYLIHT